MRDITDLVEAATKSEESKMFWMLELQFNTTLRYTDCDIDLYKETAVPGTYDKFVSTPFSFGSINYSAKSSVDKLKIEIENVDLAMSAVFLNEDVENKWGILWVAFYDENDLLINEPIEVFRGLVGEWSLTEEKGSIVLVNEFIFWNKKVMRRHQSSCMWVFKGDECGYSGTATSCDQGYTKCLALQNSDNFGGFRWLPDLTEKDIYWGKTT